MNISELLNLTTWIEKEIIAKKILKIYQELQHTLEILNHHRNNQPLDFANQKKHLIKTLQSVNTNSLTQAQLEFLVNLNIGNYIGKNGADNIEGVLYKDAIDVATSTNKIREIINKISDGINKSRVLTS